MADETRTPSAAGAAARRAAVVSCWLCGDIRWYCKDTRACTERWISARRQARAARAAPGRGAVAAPLPRQRSPARAA